MIEAVRRFFSFLLFSVLGTAGALVPGPIQADFRYVCLMPSTDVSGMNSMFEVFSKAHGMSFRSAPLNPEGTSIAIRLEGGGAMIFAANDEGDREFYVDIERRGSLDRYRSNVAALHRDLLGELSKLNSVVVKWRRLPANYEPTVPAATRTVRGPDL